MIIPPCASPAPIGGGGALRCLCITCTGHFSTILSRYHGTLATGGCPGGEVRTVYQNREEEKITSVFFDRRAPESVMINIK